MAKTNVNPFTQRKVTGQAIPTQANTQLGAVNTNAAIAVLYTASAEGALVRRVSAIPLQTIQATQLQLFRKKANGAIVLWKSVTMQAYNLAVSALVPSTEFLIDTDVPWALEPGEIIYAGIGVAAATGIAFTLEAEEF